MVRRPFDEPKIESAFAAFPEALREPLLDLREMVFQVAAETIEAGRLVECLKWGQPAYLTVEPKTGTTIRIGPVKGYGTGYGLFVHCQSRLVPKFRDRYGDLFGFEENRALVLSSGAPLPIEPLKHCIELALTYHLAKG